MAAPVPRTSGPATGSRVSRGQAVPGPVPGAVPPVAVLRRSGLVHGQGRGREHGRGKAGDQAGPMTKICLGLGSLGTLAPRQFGSELCVSLCLCGLWVYSEKRISVYVPSSLGWARVR